MSFRTTLTAHFAWPSIARLQNGRIAVVSSGFRREHLCPFGKAVISCSDDGGKSGRLSVYGYRAASYGVRVIFSRNSGATWDVCHILYDRGSDDDVGYPASAELDDGTILTVFYAHTDENGSAVILQQHWAIEQ